MDLKTIFRAGCYEMWAKENPVLVDALKKLVEAGEPKRKVLNHVKSAADSKSMVSSTVQAAIQHMYDSRAIKAGKKKIKI